MNDGASWTSFDNGLLKDGFNGFAVINKDTFVAFSKKHVYRSLNRGVTWDSIIPPASMTVYNMSSIVWHPTGRVLISNTVGTIFFSDDLGVTWTAQSTVPSKKPDILSLVLPNGEILAQDSKLNTLWRSSNKGTSWEFSSNGISLVSMRQLWVMGDSTMLALTWDRLVKTEDNGAHWHQLFVDESLAHDVVISVLNIDTFLVFINRQTLLTIDGGNTFVNILPGVLNMYDIIFIPNTKRIVCSYSSGFFITENLGTTWIKKSSANVTRLKYHPSGTLFGLNSYSESKILRSDDNGATWTDVTPSSFASVSTVNIDMEITKTGDLFVKVYKFNGNYSMAVTHDKGETWQENRIPFGAIKESFTVNELGHIYVSFFDWPFSSPLQKFACSIDHGASWFDLQAPLKYVNNEFVTMSLSPEGFLYFGGENGRLYRSSTSTLLGGYLRGQIRKDGDSDCSTPDAQDPLRWSVKIEGDRNYYASTSQQGKYEVFVSDTGSYQVSARLPNAVWWEPCDDIKLVHLNALMDADTASFTGRALMDCPLMQVDVAANGLRRCFNNVVSVQYCNIGTEPADSAWVEITLDPYLSIISAQLPYEIIGSNHFRFNVGPMPIDACGQFQFIVYVDCDSTIIGQTHCILAHAWPDTLCAPVNGWSGANIEAEAKCIGDSVVHLTLHNTGTGISQQLEYIVIEDQVVLSTGEYAYKPGEQVVITMPALGHTWRIESEQEPGHPFSNLAIAFTEGCAGFNSLGFINQFNTNGIRPAWDRFCMENTGAFDPNDKQGFPLGYGTENRIRPGQDLEYLIRFQNTGTDTAFTVVIRDSISPWLDPASIRPGAASHPYTWTLSGQGVLTVRFDNILLPDSTTNLAASQGFVNFHIEQQANVPLGAQILNEAYIYFDFNAPIVTNQTLHTVGLDDQSSTNHLHDSRQRPSAVQVAPNPVTDHAIFQLWEGSFRQHLLTVTDALGRTVWQNQISGSQYSFERKNLPSGVYAYRVEDQQGRLTGSGKVVLK